MAVPTATRYLARQVAKRAIRRGVQEAVTIQETDDMRRRLVASIGGFQAGVTLPSTMDSVDDLPL